MPLIPCVQCQRHVKHGDVHCPFCAAALPQTVLPPMLPARRRTSRAAMVLAALTVTAAAGSAGAGCADDDDDDDDEEMEQQPVYGAPVEDSGVPNGGEQSHDAGQAVPVYGIAPDEDAGGGIPIYGLAPDEE